MADLWLFLHHHPPLAPLDGEHIDRDVIIPPVSIAVQRADKCRAIRITRARPNTVPFTPDTIRAVANNAVERIDVLGVQRVRWSEIDFGHG